MLSPPQCKACHPQLPFPPLLLTSPCSPLFPFSLPLFPFFPFALFPPPPQGRRRFGRAADMETSSSRGRTRLGRSPASWRSPAQTSASLMFLGAGPHTPREGMGAAPHGPAPSPRPSAACWGPALAAPYLPGTLVAGCHPSLSPRWQSQCCKGWLMKVAAALRVSCWKPLGRFWGKVGAPRELQGQTGAQGRDNRDNIQKGSEQGHEQEEGRRPFLVVWPASPSDSTKISPPSAPS